MKAHFKFKFENSKTLQNKNFSGKLFGFLFCIIIVFSIFSQDNDLDLTFAWRLFIQYEYSVPIISLGIGTSKRK